MSKALEIENLKVAFPTYRGVIRAVEGVSLYIDKGECLALVGESGCGKSVTSLAAMKLLGDTAIVRADKHIICGEDVLGFSDKQMEALRGRRVSMIFQDALSALDPVMTVGRQLDEVFIRHLRLSKKEARERSVAALAAVGIPEPGARYRSFPHELSGGMRQRVLIAMAFACEPELIIADEPTTALDVTIQAQILELLKKMQQQSGTALLFISHDLSVVSNMADRIAVMYSGKIAEQAQRDELIARPLHPYTRGLLSAVIGINDKKDSFIHIKGTLPDPAEKPKGCYFCPRCSEAGEVCFVRQPLLKERGSGHYVRCHYLRCHYLRCHSSERGEKNE